MDMVTCTHNDRYRDALTRGQPYQVIARDDEKRQIRIIDNRGRTRWYSLAYFERGVVQVSFLQAFQIDDPIRNPYCDTVEVSLIIVKGTRREKRWCYFITPAYIYQMSEFVAGEPIMMGAHGLILPRLAQDTIASALACLERSNLLESATRPFDHRFDDRFSNQQEVHAGDLPPPCG